MLDAIVRLEPSYRTFLQELVRTPSPVGDEGAAQALVAQRMSEIGLAVDRFDIDASALGGHEAFNRSPRRYDGRPCVAGRRKGAGRGRSLVLNAHVDTVPVEGPEKWSHPPFAAVVEDGRLYGRGACDDKAGIAECLLVAHALREAGIELAGDLIVTSVVEDESSGNGTLAAVERGYTGDGVIIVDGTWPERVIVSHMGQVSFRIRLTGVEGHATSTGPNPIDAVGLVVDALRACVERTNDTQPQPWGPRQRAAFVNIGTIHGGAWPGSVPAECVIEGQYGFPPPASCAQSREALRSAMATIGQDPAWPLAESPAIEFVGLETPPEVGDAGNPIVQLLTATVRRRQNAALIESVVAGHCDLRHYTHARAHRTNAACLYGPGGGKNVHGRDEYFELAHLPLVAGNLACVALEWCGVAGER